MKHHRKKESPEVRALKLPLRQSGQCEWCKRWFEERQAAHVFAKGQGGTEQMEKEMLRIGKPIFLCGLCWECHGLHHDGHRPLPLDLLVIAAAREGVLQHQIEAAYYAARNPNRRFPDATIRRVDEAAAG